MVKKCSKSYKIELTKDELDILNKASNIIKEIDDFATENDIEELQDFISIDEYIDALKPQYKIEDNSTSSDSSAWDCPSWYTDEQRRCFYGSFG